jgi:hypothetical protein
MEAQMASEDRFPMECALCGVVWHRELGDAPPKYDPPHDHTAADWDAYLATIDPTLTYQNVNTPIWTQITGVEYPPLPPWPPELGPPPAGTLMAEGKPQRHEWKKMRR